MTFYQINYQMIRYLGAENNKEIGVIKRKKLC